MLKNRMSFRVAFCGILAALMTVIMLVGPLIPTMTYVAPAAAGVFLIPVVWEFGGKTGGLLYAAVALLARSAHSPRRNNFGRSRRTYRSAIRPSTTSYSRKLTLPRTKKATSSRAVQLWASCCKSGMTKTNRSRA